MKIKLRHTFKDIISIDNLLCAWREFIKGKRGKSDVQRFQLYLMGNILSLREDLRNKTYQHGAYKEFKISDPKPRIIHKASVRDRLIHHALYRKLYPFYDKTFIADSYSCRKGKGTHKAINRFRRFFWKVSQNNTKTCWVLKCDIKKFFASIDHKTLVDILKEHIPDKDVLWLLEEVIESFNPGLPLGNLTSQLLVNIYMSEFDQFVKHKLKAKYYIRYADDFVILSENKEWLEAQAKPIRTFLNDRLKLTVHKVCLKTFASGVDFLGWVHFPDHRALRTTTKKRMFRKIQKHPNQEKLNSYLGLIGHGNTYKLRQRIV